MQKLRFDERALTLNSLDLTWYDSLRTLVRWECAIRSATMHCRASCCVFTVHACAHFSSSTRMKYAFATSYADQQIAVLGAAVTTRAFIPLKNPAAPSLRAMMAAASNKPLAFRSSGSVALPRVCSSVLITSSGVVAAAAIPPAKPPAVQCVRGS